ncbi:tRNA lysidine(34) synthetase TilS [Luteolibacter yonseiensis]|uniref:tRNA(Ile)-lysidine synthase n=1 Tax=Luteolibacter yonseiensis TaxID=1144680 RepID=A0A934R9U6_9BACT|nr:tRNA lysidine(34) synthetase TilS [Luteolibacter yonseiensis]MBK1817810.1 tRNA lysidine(34) synthetase TilS [Luteolibacter yonseiensis]
MLPAKNIPWFATASREERWLVGVSGGADSVALLHFLVEAGFENLVVCHLDHGLRGSASAGDADFVGNLAAGYGIPCEIGRADVASRIKERSESLETAARNERHAFFFRCAEKHDCPRILLAHHADDQAETVLWNLLRGSHGLKGMRERSMMATKKGTSLEIVRPLLGVRRAELVGWLTSRELPWREDASNAEPIAIRNRLRNEVLPLLDEITGRDSIQAFARGAADTEERAALEDWAFVQADVLDPQGRLHVPALRKLPVSLQRLALRKFLIDDGVTAVDRELLESALGLLDVGNAPVINLPGGGRLRRKEGRLWVEKMHEE